MNTVNGNLRFCSSGYASVYVLRHPSSMVMTTAFFGIEARWPVTYS
jgi:hypothetical protein